MISRSVVVAVVLTATVTNARADGPPMAITADFKLQVASFGPAEKPVYTEEIVVRTDRIYVFPSNSKEVTIVEPGRSVVDIVDVGRRVQTEVTFATLESALAKIRESMRAAAENLEKQGGRGKLLEARMARDLFETRLEVSFDDKVNRVRLKDPAVEIDANGEPESDPTRLAFVKSALVNIARLGAYRTPNDLPPFVELEAIAALTGERNLRPTSISYLYRLAGPPRKIRRTYKLVAKLTSRDVEAIGRVDRLRSTALNLRYDQYRTDR